MIYLISGKGGVGKSLISASLGKSLADQGRKVLVVELGSYSYLSLIYNFSSSFEPKMTSHGFSLALWDGATALREYFLHLLKIQKVVDIFFDNRVSQALVDGAPGLKELALTGKITSGIRKIGPKLPFDDIIVDAYSTGHFKALIKAPLAMSEAIKIGPMGEQSRNIDQVLKDPKFTRYLVVINPEELAVTEGLELKDFLVKEFGVDATLIGNRWWPSFSASELEKLPPAFLEKQSQVLKLQIPVGISLPQIWDTSNLDKIERLSSFWKGWSI